MNILSLDDFQKLKAGGTLVCKDKRGEKVLTLSDGTMLKLFRRKRLVSSAAWYPYAERFADNCAALAKISIPCPEVISVARVIEISRDVVHYHPLSGKTVRQIVREGVDAPSVCELRRAIGLFFAKLHRQGVYFRSIHLGNVVLTPEGLLGLIDVADLTIRRRPLSAFWIKRNLQHALRYEADWDFLMQGHEFLEGYSSGGARIDQEWMFRRG